MRVTKWNLGHVYDLTDYFNSKAKEIFCTDNNGEPYYKGYYVATDVWDTHIYRIVVGINAESEDEPRTKIIEEERLPHYKLAEHCIEELNVPSELFEDADERCYVDILLKYLGIKELLKTIFECDSCNGFETYDVEEYRYDTPMETLIDDIDGSYGISKISIDDESEN